MQYLSYPFFREMALSYEIHRYMFDGNNISLTQQYLKTQSFKLLKFARRSWIQHWYAIKKSWCCTANYFGFVSFSPFSQHSCCCLRPHPWAPHSVLTFVFCTWVWDTREKGREHQSPIFTTSYKKSSWRTWIRTASVPWAIDSWNLGDYIWKSVFIFSTFAEELQIALAGMRCWGTGSFCQGMYGSNLSYNCQMIYWMKTSPNLLLLVWHTSHHHHNWVKPSGRPQLAGPVSPW